MRRSCVQVETLKCRKPEPASHDLLVISVAATLVLGKISVHFLLFEPELLHIVIG
jgi:hypothetical protein